MKKVLTIIIILIVLIVIAVVGIGIYNHVTNNDGQSRVPNDVAEKDTQNRYLTIINDINQIINEVHIFVGEGTEIEHGYQLDPDEKSFSIKIPESYAEYDTFMIEVIDRYGLKYEKQITNVNKEGRTEVKISENDYIKKEGDWKKKIDKWFNND